MRKHQGNIGVSIVMGELPARIPQVLVLNLDTLEVLSPSIAESLEILKMYVRLEGSEPNHDSKPRRFLKSLLSLFISRIYW